MLIGVPQETKDNEYRVALTPEGAGALVGDGHTVRVQRGAGAGSGFGDDAYAAAGATLTDAAGAWDADLVLRVKEPLAPEFALLREGGTLFTYLHLAAAREAAEALLARRVTGVAYETVQTAGGGLPLLAPMSEVAGRLAVQVGAHYLEKPQGGFGRLLGGIPGVPPALVVVLGAGAVGSHAARQAAGMGARVLVLNNTVDRLRALTAVLPGIETGIATPAAVAAAVREADLVVGTVLVPGASAPRVVTRAMVASMRPGSVIVDVSVDQGGCVETTRPTSHSHPVYVEEGVTHYAVTNMPGAVPHTSTIALTNATLPYAQALAHWGSLEAARRDPALALGINTHAGHIVHAGVAEALGVEALPLADVLKS
jgi:alanine dehydrogenase